MGGLLLLLLLFKLLQLSKQLYLENKFLIKGSFKLAKCHWWKCQQQ